MKDDAEPLISHEQHRRAIRRAGVAIARYNAAAKGKAGKKEREAARRWWALWMAVSGIRKFD
jgi:hypothetical protein